VINHKDQTGMSPLCYALMTENNDIIRILVNSGVDLEEIDENGVKVMEQASKE